MKTPTSARSRKLPRKAPAKIPYGLASRNRAVIQESKGTGKTHVVNARHFKHEHTPRMNAHGMIMPEYVLNCVLAGLTPRALEQALATDSLSDVAASLKLPRRNVEMLCKRWGIIAA